jgi:hypothetical protein
MTLNTIQDALERRAQERARDQTNEIFGKIREMIKDIGLDGYTIDGLSEARDWVEEKLYDRFLSEEIEAVVGKRRKR